MMSLFCLHRSCNSASIHQTLLVLALYTVVWVEIQMMSGFPCFPALSLNETVKLQMIKGQQMVTLLKLLY